MGWTVCLLAVTGLTVASSSEQQVLLPPFLPSAPSDPPSTIIRKSHDFVSDLGSMYTTGADNSDHAATQTLRHIYHKGSHRYPGLLRALDVHSDTRLLATSDADRPASRPPTSFRVSTTPVTIQRLANRNPRHINTILDASRNSLYMEQGFSLPASDWSLDTVQGPDITDMQSITSFAYMAANAYILEPGTGDWKDIKGGFNYTQDFGWESDGLRGHIFADTTNSTIVIGLKGTSPAVFDGADTTGNDKLNDNLFGSCCCGQGGQYSWKSVCDCRTDTYTCNNTCLLKSLREKSHYYHAAKDLYLNVTELYPDADIWLTGHSLGGVVTSLLGLTFGLPTITFEAFPDALAASRLGLPTPPGYHIGSHGSRANTGITHFGHTADPVYMGTCNSAFSACTIGGYAFQSQCHTGQTCTFDTVGDLGWRVGIRTHAIQSVVKDVLPKYNKAPSCRQDVDCVDCFNWTFYESNGSDPRTTVTSGSSTATSTRTATCQTPGWWGCLDSSTTISEITQTSTITTTTCLTPGWFGCKETANLTQTTTITTETHVPITTTTTTMTTSGDGSSQPPSRTASRGSASETGSVVSSTSAVTSTCLTPGWFGKCLDSATHDFTELTTSSTPFVTDENRL